jgi:predicted Zn-dependent protease
MVWSMFIGGGFGLLIGLAVLVGQMQAQENAWRAIARERRELGARRRELAAAAESDACPHCGRQRER